MDDDGLNMRNWGYYEPSFREHLNLQLMSPNPDTKPFFSTRENPLLMNPNLTTNHHYHPPTSLPSDQPLPMNYMRDGWIQRERLHHMLPGNNHNFPIIPTTSSIMPLQMVPPLDLPKNMTMEDNLAVRNDTTGDGTVTGGGSVKKRGGAGAGKFLKPKKQKKVSSTAKQNGNSSSSSTQRSKTVKRTLDVVINGIDMDISGIPIPVCSCTGASQQCYRWGSGGWQSACCTTTISMYPLPMSTKRRGARIAGRKMSQGAFKKVLEKLASEGYNFANAIDLKSYWAKHGTNKFVTIR